MKRYVEYKDSEVPWIGEIPKGWEVKKLKYIGEAIIGLTYSPDDVCDKHEGTLVLRSSNIQNGKLVFIDNVFVNKAIAEKLIVKIGDILICSRNGSRELIGKNAIIDENCMNYSFGAFMTVFRTKYFHFIYHVFNSFIFKYLSGSFLTSTVNQLTTGNLNNMMIPFPPLQTQQSISAYLDRKTAAIDSLIEDKQKLIELLKEKRQAIISEAVTKGLKKNSNMKDSGVEWIGEIPEDWDICRVKNVGNIKSGMMISNELIDDEYEYEVWGGNGLLGYCNQFNVEGPCLVIGRVGALCGNVRISSEKRYITDNALILNLTNRNYNLNFLYYVLYTAKLGDLNTSNAQPLITGTKVLNLYIPLVEFEVQNMIVEFLDKKIADIDSLVADISQQIEKLKEYRQAIISEAVTGKVAI